ncbi:MAG: LysR family transcriptional regulator [Armatimonadota bacterium]|nr:LysR family transcriptional regulator [Armatimonadota bacterium]MDR7574338.1 LysR family transcriptional regulator [Armatimonadota bacterium]
MRTRRDDLLDNWHRLVVFQRVAQARSFTRAAASLHLSQPAVSAHIRALEDALGRRLFERTPRGVDLTEAGRTLLAHVNRGLQALRDGLHTVAAGQGPDPLTIGTVVSASLSLLPCILERFRTRHPTVRVAMRVGRSSDIARLLRDGAVHVGIVVARPSLPGVTVRMLLEEPVVCVGPPTHRLAGRRAVPLTDLSDELLLLARWGEGCEVLVRALRDALGEQFSPAVEVDPADAAKQMALQGVGLTFLGESLVRTELAAGTLVRIDVAGLPPLTRRVYLIYPRGSLSVPVRTFLEAAVQAARETMSGRGETRADSRSRESSGGLWGSPPTPSCIARADV